MDALFWPAAVLVVAALSYVAAVRRLQQRHRPWAAQRTAAYAAGIALLAVALLPPLADHDEDFTVHAVQHLLLGMAAPTLLALAAPLTLLIATAPPRWRRWLVRLLRSAVLRVVTHPLSAALLSVGSLFLLYTTGLYQLTLEHPALHLLVHLHVFVAGYLFAAALVGSDPHPHRSSLSTRLVALVLAGGAHNVLAKLLYAHGPASWAVGAQIMWYGGDLIELFLAVLLFGQWYRQEGRRLATRANAG
jgi:putative membrane protein